MPQQARQRWRRQWHRQVTPTAVGNRTLRPPPYNTNLRGGDETKDQETDDDEEECARHAFINALKQSAPNDPNSTATVRGTLGTTTTATTTGNNNNGYNNNGKDGDDEYKTKSKVRWEKERRKDTVRQLSIEANCLHKRTHVTSDVGWIYSNEEDGVMEEAEQTLATLTAAPDAL
jgi:hypothetical protein